MRRVQAWAWRAHRDGQLASSSAMFAARSNGRMSEAPSGRRADLTSQQTGYTIAQNLISPLPL
jgi:hypothetical protein